MGSAALKEGGWGWDRRAFIKHFWVSTNADALFFLKFSFNIVCSWHHENNFKQNWVIFGRYLNLLATDLALDIYNENDNQHILSFGIKTMSTGKKWSLFDSSKQGNCSQQGMLWSSLLNAYFFFNAKWEKEDIIISEKKEKDGQQGKKECL